MEILETNKNNHDMQQLEKISFTNLKQIII